MKHLIIKEPLQTNHTFVELLLLLLKSNKYSTLKYHRIKNIYCIKSRYLRSKIHVKQIYERTRPQYFVAFIIR